VRWQLGGCDEGIQQEAAVAVSTAQWRYSTSTGTVHANVVHHESAEKRRAIYLILKAAVVNRRIKQICGLDLLIFQDLTQLTTKSHKSQE
jgi:hypothetical protein